MTLKATLRHIGWFYEMCDRRYGAHSLDQALGENSASTVLSMVSDFYLELTQDTAVTNATVVRWGAVRTFLKGLVTQLITRSPAWASVDAYLDSVGKIRRPSRGKFRFVRALPDSVLAEVLQVAHPHSDRNPFEDPGVRLRNWLIVHLLVLGGLRRGELLLLVLDSLKHDVDHKTGQITYWLDVTNTDEDDDRATRPSIKTEASHRQVPISDDLAELYEHYVSDVRVSDQEDTTYLITSMRGTGLSAESVTKIFEGFTSALSEESRQRFRVRSGGKAHISPHDLRHTCATARYPSFLAKEGDKELALQRMRAFFGWSIQSEMPELYARSAIQDDLLRTWNDVFDKRISGLRRLQK
ncbi:MAG: tyrosine-type recombinase/integrase [Candidatus Methylomirabilaceae bacterium]